MPKHAVSRTVIDIDFLLGKTRRNDPIFDLIGFTRNGQVNNHGIRGYLQQQQRMADTQAKVLTSMSRMMESMSRHHRNGRDPHVDAAAAAHRIRHGNKTRVFNTPANGSNANMSIVPGPAASPVTNSTMPPANPPGGNTATPAAPPAGANTGANLTSNPGGGNASNADSNAAQQLASNFFGVNPFGTFGSQSDNLLNQLPFHPPGDENQENPGETDPSPHGSDPSDIKNYIVFRHRPLS
ncbi:hypothetical protein FA13DRAFT_1904607 [Coprinellus micaceus]|uniref:Uncharacterized protein n=1 Tax=Coprinellus micaceus TaxID=71717 RepID=A0A4Y7STL8_COPMI|nr:hypothetical protein FA13DRAFT_1904607 [Coprinellus micaceus]